MLLGICEERSYVLFDPTIDKRSWVSESAVACPQESLLDRINPFAFYEFGSELQPLKVEYASDVLASAVMLSMFFASWRLDRLLKKDPIEVVLSAGAARTLKTK
jgi:hypothetical protein